MAQPCFLVNLKYFKNYLNNLLTKVFNGVIIYLEVKERGNKIWQGENKLRKVINKDNMHL